MLHNCLCLTDITNAVNLSVMISHVIDPVAKLKIHAYERYLEVLQ